MPRKTKDARPGRVTPKGGPPPKRKVTSASAATATDSGRYTAPIPREFKSSPWWVPAMMIAFFGSGVVLILINYLGAIWATSNVYLFIGLGLIVCGFITSTRWH
ncbi:MAG TPA: cell division protein CrgA [Acidimicrobiales bacterium]|jgi:hypothetical protein|nr:cell division protein CrgA [Acidimicrobiales bacterium]